MTITLLRCLIICVAGLLIGCAGPDAAAPDSVSVAPPASEASLAFQSDDAATDQFVKALQRLYATAPSAQGNLTRIAALDRRTNAQARLLRPDLSVTARSFGQARPAAQLSMPLFEFGKKGARTAQARANTDLAAQDLATIRSDLLARALNAAVTYHDATARIALQQRRIKDFRAAAQAATRLMNMGLATSAESRLAMVKQKEADLALLQAQTDRSEAQASWARLFGDEGAPPNLNMRDLRRASGIATTAAAVAQATKRGIAARNQASLQRSLSAETEMIRTRGRPTVGLSAQLFLDREDDRTAGGLTFDLPLYAQNTRDDLLLAQAETNAAEAEMIALQRDTRFNVTSSARQADAARRLADQRAETLNLLRQRVADVTQQSETGLARYTDVIDARATLFDAEAAILEGRYRAALAEAQIIIATGVLVP